MSKRDGEFTLSQGDVVANSIPVKHLEMPVSLLA